MSFSSLGLLLGTVSLAGCEQDDIVESEATGIATATASQALTTESTEADANGNSLPSEELAFIPNMGFVDGTTCQTWPGTLSYGQLTGGVLALDDTLERYQSGTEEATLLTKLRDAFIEHDVSSVSAIGSKNTLMIWYSGGKQYLLDSRSEKGYELNAQYFCTKSDVEATQCETYSAALEWPSHTWQILRRKEPRTTGIPTVMITAPTIMSGHQTTIDLNMIWVANEITSSNREGEKGTISQQPYVNKSSWADYSSAHKPGLLVLVASKITDIEKIESFTAAPEKLRIEGDSANDDQPNDTFNEYVISPQALFPLDAPLSWGNMVSQLSYSTEVQMGWWKHHYVRQYDAQVSFAPLPPKREDDGKGGTVIVVAETMPEMEVRAPGVRPTVISGFDANQSYIGELFSSLDSLTVEREEINNVYREAHVSTKGRTCEDLTGASVWANDYLDFCHKSDGYWSCDYIKAPDPACDVCVEPLTASYTIGETLSGSSDTIGYGNPYQNALDLSDFSAKIFNATSSYYQGKRNNIPGPDGTALAQTGTRGLVSTVANVLSRGLFFTELYNSADNTSRRQTTPDSDKWQLAYQQSDKSLLLAPLKEEYRITSSLPDVFGIPWHRSNVAAGWALYGRSALPGSEHPLNALGMRYGRVGTGWRDLSMVEASNAPSKTYLNVQERWERVSDMVEFLNTAKNAQDNDEKLAELQDSLSEVITTATDFIDKVGDASSALQTAASDNVTSQAQAVERITELLGKVKEEQRDLEQKIRTIWDCHDMVTNPDGSMDYEPYTVCVDNMTKLLNAISDKCREQDLFPGFVGAIAAAIPYVATAGAAIDAVGLTDSIQKALGKPNDGFTDDPLQEAVDAIGGASVAVDGAIRAIEPGVEASETIKALVELGLPDCNDADVTLYATAKQALQAMVVLDSMMQLYATDLETLQGLLASTLAHVQHLMVSAEVYGELAFSSATASTALSNIDVGSADVKNDMAARRTFIRAACRTTLAANHLLQTDLYGVSQALQTTVGQSYLAPSLYVPSLPTHLDSTSTATSLGFLVSLWEPERFGRRLSDSGQSTENFMSLARARVSTFWDEVCNPSGDSLPRTRFVVRKTIMGDQLDRLRSTGSVPFSISLDDVIRGGNGGSSAVTAVAASYSNQWYPLGAPVVLSTAYAACTGPEATPCSTRTDLPTEAPYLVKNSESLVPTLSCEPTRVSNRAAEPLHARVETCLQPVMTPPRSWELSYKESLKDGDETVATDLMDAACEVDVAVVDWGPHRGLPVIGPWMLAANQNTISGRRIPASIANDVKAIEVAFVVGAEPENGAPTSRILERVNAFRTQDCAAKEEGEPNGIDEDCNGVIDDGLIPATMGFEPGELAQWTATSGSITYSSNHTEGETSLEVSTQGYADLTSSSILTSEFREIGDIMLLDVFIAEGQPNPYWLGGMNLSFSMPSQNLHDAFIGNAGLTGLMIGEWNTISFGVPENLQQTMLAATGALQFKLGISAPGNAPPMLLDNLRFAGTLRTRGAGTATRGTFAEVLSFERLLDWKGTQTGLTLDNTLVTHGRASLRLDRTSSYSTVTSASLYAWDFGGPKSRVFVDVLTDVAPSWGGVQLTMQCPLSKTAWVGMQSVAGLEPNVFHTLEFSLPESLQAAIVAHNSECNLTLVVSASLDGSYRFDNIRFQ